VASHLLGHVVGSWGAVAIVTIVAIAAYARILQRDRALAAG
jgi:predicted Zn-dependent protease